MEIQPYIVRYHEVLQALDDYLEWFKVHHLSSSLFQDSKYNQEIDWIKKLKKLMNQTLHKILKEAFK